MGPIVSFLSEVFYSRCSGTYAFIIISSGLIFSCSFDCSLWVVIDVRIISGEVDGLRPQDIRRS